MIPDTILIISKDDALNAIKNKIIEKKLTPEEAANAMKYAGYFFDIAQENGITSKEDDLDDILKLSKEFKKFTDKMWTRIVEKFQEGWKGWDHPNFKKEIIKKVEYCINHGQYEDGANFLMFRSYHKSKITGHQPKPPKRERYSEDQSSGEK